jgi:hypothetical protein
MYELVISASPFPRAAFEAPVDASVRIGDALLVTPTPAYGKIMGKVIVLIESVREQRLSATSALISGVLSFLAGMSTDGELIEPPSRITRFVGEATRLPTTVAATFFGRVDAERDPISKAMMQPAALDVGTLLSDGDVKVVFNAAGFNRHTAVLAQSGAGKSYSVGVLLEELIQNTKLRLVIVDPNGDYDEFTHSMAAQLATAGSTPSNLEVASSRNPEDYERALDGTFGSGRGCELNLSRLDRALWPGMMMRLLNAAWASRQRRIPTLIVLDEAHNFAPDSPTTDGMQEAIIQIAGEGRKYGLWFLIASQRPQKLHANLISQCDNLILMKLTSQYDLDHIAASFSGASRDMVQMARGFKKGSSLAIGGIVRCATLFAFRERHTPEGGGDLSLDWAAQP